jgi:ParB family chromosome partitioning protein
MSQTYPIEMISIDEITVINSRERSEKSFQAVKSNIESVGLKRPVTVRPSDDGEGYDLVCGEGRLKSFIALGETTIPAIVRYDLPKDDAYVMSLVENMARRQHTSVDLMAGIKILRDQGYGVMEISRKTGLADSYVSGISTLLNKGEERLIAAVEKGQIPLSIAITIASSPGEEQATLQDAYEKEELRGNRFLMAQRLIEKRKTLGKGMKGRNGSRNKNGETISARQMVQKFKTEMDRMHAFVEKANMTEATLMIIVESFFNILKDENFTTLLRAEGLNTMPETLADMITEREAGYV